jgi:hypothetical protein
MHAGRFKQNQRDPIRALCQIKPRQTTNEVTSVVGNRDLASRIHVRNAAESGQTRTDVNDPKRHGRTQIVYRSLWKEWSE